MSKISTVYPLLLIPPGMSAETLRRYGYEWFAANQADLPSNAYRATRQQLDAWYASLPDISTFAGSEQKLYLQASGGKTLAGFVASTIQNVPLKDFVSKYFTIMTPTTPVDPNNPLDPRNPQPGEPGYDKYVTSVFDSVNLLNFLERAWAEFIKPWQQIAGAFTSISGFLAEQETRFKNTATNAVALVQWIDQPATLERFGAIILGAVLLWLGLNVFVTSFVDIETAVKTAAKVAAL